MIQAFFTYDLFDTTTGTLTVEYNIFDKVTESCLMPYEKIREQMETRVRQIICDKIERMRNQRSENYKYGDSWGIKASKALFEIPIKLVAARNIKNMKIFAEYIQVNIRPLLDEILPNINSRFYENFIKKLNLLDEYMIFILKNPGFCSILYRKENTSKAV